MRERVIVVVYLSVCLLTVDLESRCINGRKRHEQEEDDDISPFNVPLFLNFGLVH